jgi:hypothetical protein
MDAENEKFEENKENKFKYSKTPNVKKNGKLLEGDTSQTEAIYIEQQAPSDKARRWSLKADDDSEEDNSSEMIDQKMK